MSVEHKVSSTIVETDAAKWPERFSDAWYKEYGVYTSLCMRHDHSWEKTDHWDIAGWMTSEKRAEWQQEEANKFAAQFSTAVEHAIVAETENVIKDRIGDAADRKAVPLFAGVLAYFPDAFVELARLSKIGNDQHNPGEPLHWARGKSGDELDALTRHLLDAGSIDTDGVRHSTKLLWRAAANLQKELERDLGLPLSRGSKEGKKA